MWICPNCGRSEREPPFCFGADAPWRYLVPEGEFDRRVELTADQCVVDERAFFIRGHIEIPILDAANVFLWSVWCSLSRESFEHVTECWESPARGGDSYFGWLSTEIPIYPNTLNLKTTVVSREVGRVPLVRLQATEHPLFHDQEHGITLDRAHQISHSLLHET